MIAYGFTSVRQINKAIQDAFDRAGEGPRVVTPTGTLQITRARADRDGFLHVRLVANGEWIDCSWHEVVMP